MISRARNLRSGFLGIGASLSVGAIVALGCGSESTESTPSTDPGAVAEQPTAPKAVDEVWLASLPEDFPPDVPVYPDAAVGKALSTPDSGIKVAWTTPDAPEKVAAFFDDSLAGQGWSTQRMDGPDGTLVFADKGTRSATFAIGGSEGNTTIDLLLVEMR